MKKKFNIYNVFSIILTVYSSVISYLIYDGDARIIFNILWPASGLAAGIGGIILSINAKKKNGPNWLCIITLIIAILSTSINALNFIACVMCASACLTEFV